MNGTLHTLFLLPNTTVFTLRIGVKIDGTTNVTLKLIFEA